MGIDPYESSVYIGNPVGDDAHIVPQFFMIKRPAETSGALFFLYSILI